MTSPLLVILGETASGKSKLAMELAEQLNGEIICADSWTVRRGVDIGTDKPNEADRKLVPHHLIDIVDPDEEFTAAVYKRLAIKAVEEIDGRGKLPIMVGGSGLYIDSVIFNYGFLEAGDRRLREKLNEKSLYELLDIISVKRLPLENIDTRNKRRLIRLIESEGAKPSIDPLRDNTLVVGVSRDSQELKELIVKRVDSMISAGLEAEVRSLVADYGWSCEALKGVGYKQWHGYIDGTKNLEETHQQIITATSNLAKKQRAWFKRNKSIHWYPQPINLEEIVDLATTHLSSRHF
ncbi:MAG TPA: tRNA (adenosine(37)-N6)-dimethylallyltransferase MiaA [Candidatus Saccharimonadales bacterium]